MYDVTVSGRTYPVSKTLRDQGLRWNPTSKIWFGAVGDGTVELLRSLPGINIEVSGEVAAPVAAPVVAPPCDIHDDLMAPAIDPEVAILEAEIAAGVSTVETPVFVRSRESEAVKLARALSASMTPASAPTPAPAGDPVAILMAPAAFDRVEALALLATVKDDLIAAARKFKALEALLQTK